MNKIISIITFGILFIIIYAGISSATVEMPNIEMGDGIWGTINVDTPGLVSVNAYGAPTSSYDVILLKLYNQAGKLVDSKSGSAVSIDYFAPDTGTYKFKVILASSYLGGTRTISASSNKQLSLMPKYIQRAYNVYQGGALFYDLYVKKGELVFIDAWSGTDEDTISLYLYSQTGQVANNSGYRGEMDYVAPADGAYTAKAVLKSVYLGGTRTISVSSNFPSENSTLITTPFPTPTIIPTPPKLGSGSVLITSYPSGASIYLDGTYSGITPNKLTNLPQGSLAITLKLEGYNNWQQNIDITSSNTSYIPVALAPSPSTRLQSLLTPETGENFSEFMKEISNLSRRDKENMVSIQLQDANESLENGKYDEAKAYTVMAKAISEDLEDKNLIKKSETLLEVVNKKIESKESTKLIYELLLALGAALIFGYTFGDTFERKMKKKVYKYLIIVVVFIILFFVFYILGRFL